MPTKHIGQHVTSTEFANDVSRYLNDAGKEPIVITQHNRPACVLIDIDEYKRLAAYDTRQYLHPSELSCDQKKDLETAEMDSQHNHLNGLLD